jgi:GDPmannose 4,6-dehydratase
MPLKKAFITGVTGQDGAYLSKLLLEKGYVVFGLVRRSTKTNYENLDFLGITKKINFVSGDMTDDFSLTNALKSIQPDEIYNLAAQSFVGASWDHSKVTTEINSLGTLNLLNAMKLHCPKARFYQASTSEMFGSSTTNGVQSEETPFAPKSPYAVSKLYAYWIMRNFRESFGLFCCNGILFNHESPIRGKEYVTRKITSSVARIKLGLQDKIILGNLDAKRDWGFAGDYVEAMWMILQQKEAKDYVIATGKMHSIKEFLEIAFAHVGIKDWEKYVRIDSSLKRPLDVIHYPGDSSLAEKELNWKPKVDFKRLVEMMIDNDLRIEKGAVNEN